MYDGMPSSSVRSTLLEDVTWLLVCMIVPARTAGVVHMCAKLKYLALQCNHPGC